MRVVFVLFCFLASIVPSVSWVWWRVVVFVPVFVWSGCVSVHIVLWPVLYCPGVLLMVCSWTVELVWWSLWVYPNRVSLCRVARL